MCITCYGSFEVQATVDIKGAENLLARLSFKGLHLYGTPNNESIRFMYSTMNTLVMEEHFGEPIIDKRVYTYHVKGKGSIVVNKSTMTVTILSAEPTLHAPEPAKPSKKDLPPELLSQFELIRSKSSKDYKRLMLLAWRHYNQLLFQNKLRRPAFGLVPITESAGQFKVRGLWYPVSERLELSPRVFNAEPQVFVEVLLHEMCHEAVSQVDKMFDDDGEGGHGEHWRAWMHKIGEVPSRFDKYDNVAYMDKDEKKTLDDQKEAGLLPFKHIVYPVPAIAIVGGEHIPGLLIGPANAQKTRWDFMQTPPTVDSKGVPTKWRTLSLDNLFQYNGHLNDSDFETPSWVAIIHYIMGVRQHSLLATNLTGGIMDSQMQDLKTLIEAFLRLNSSPSDEQVHSLAEALGCSPAALEEAMYKMLANPVNADSQEITEGLVDPEDTNINDLASNDGDTKDDDQNLQETLSDDGVAVDDEGVGLGVNDNSVLTDDGVPDLTGV